MRWTWRDNSSSKLRAGNNQPVSEQKISYSGVDVNTNSKRTAQYRIRGPKGVHASHQNLTLLPFPTSVLRKADARFCRFITVLSFPCPRVFRWCFWFPEDFASSIDYFDYLPPLRYLHWEAYSLIYSHCHQTFKTIYLLRWDQPLWYLSLNTMERVSGTIVPCVVVP